MGDGKALVQGAYLPTKEDMEMKWFLAVALEGFIPQLLTVSKDVFGSFWEGTLRVLGMPVVNRHAEPPRQLTSGASLTRLRADAAPTNEPPPLPPPSTVDGQDEATKKGE